MIDTNKLRGAIAQNGLTQCKVAKKIGVSPKTFYSKMKRGVFGSDEIYTMIKILKIEEPMEIFFTDKVT